MPGTEEIEKQETPEEEAERVRLEQEAKQKIEAAKDELERANTGLPNAAPLVQGIKAAAEKIHRSTTKEEWDKMTPAQQEIAAREELAKYEEPLRAPAKLQPPSAPGAPPDMTGVGASGTSVPDIPRIAPGPRAGRQVQIDEVMSLKIELLTQKMATHQRDEQLAKIALQDVKRAAMELAAERRALLAELSEQVGFEVRGNVKLIDKEKRLIAVEG
jgi:hypothetical protein